MKQLKFLMAGALLLHVSTAAADETETNTSAQTKLVINELMQSNIDCIMDDLTDFPDSWVELYNPGDEAVELSDYKIGTKDKVKKANELPSMKVAPKGYVVIYCDKSREDGDKASLHTDFRLESGKDGAVYLFLGEEIVDQLTEMKKQPAPNIAYGRVTDGAEKWGYQLTPTPGEANTGETCDNKQILGSPVFSEPGRVVAGSLNLSLELSVPEGSPEGTEIRYTTDGTEPTVGSKLYESPISITKSTVVMAKLFCKGWLSPRATAQSYINHGRSVTIPVISIAINDKYLNDSKIGIYANNKDKEHAHDWRRPLNIEFFFGEGETSVINQLCEARVAGGQSRSEPLKTLAVYANKRFGEKRFDYEIFPEDKPGLTDYKSLMLRNSGNDFGGIYMRDPIIQRNAAHHIDLDWQAYRPAVVYYNGKYMGMLNIRERSNEDNIYTNYDGLEDLDMFENWNELKEGTRDNLDQFKAFYNETGHTKVEYDELMDVEEFLNIMIVNLYHTNLDFPGNNNIMWRPTAKGGRWRWVMKDTDFGLGLYNRDPNYKIFNWINNNNFDPANNWANNEEGTVLFRHLMDDEAVKTLFIDRCFIYTGDFLNEKGIHETMDPMIELAKAEIAKHKELYKPWWWAWGNYDGANALNDEIKGVNNWLSKRTDAFIKNLADYYKLGTPFTMTVNKGLEQAADGGFTINGVKLSNGIFDGKFAAGRQLTIEADETSGLNVTGWSVRTDGKETEYDGAKLELTTPACSSLVITAKVDGTGIREVKSGRITKGDVYDLNGHKVRQGSTSLEGLPKGIYIIGGRKVVK
ncbi:MAG: CotH kinase family protein [Prevotella sp.]|nr:CotH kinase family protein [Prevotella sp.]